ncbi:MAG: hypothetical protein KC549_00320 [Myxococcales bacterium]|nr:hypothetical protein [Myxococcales bacterium]
MPVGASERRGTPVVEYLAFGLGDLLRKLIATSGCVERGLPPGLFGLPFLGREERVFNLVEGEFDGQPGGRRFGYAVQHQPRPADGTQRGLLSGTQVDVTFLVSVERANVPGAAPLPPDALNADGVFLAFGSLDSRVPVRQPLFDGVAAMVGAGDPRRIISDAVPVVQPPIAPLALGGRGNVYLAGRPRGDLPVFAAGPGHRVGFDPAPPEPLPAVLDGVDARGLSPQRVAVDQNRTFSEAHQGLGDRPICSRFRLTLSIATLSQGVVTMPDNLRSRDVEGYSVRINGQYIAGFGLPFQRRRLVSHDFSLRDVYAGQPELLGTALVPWDAGLVQPLKYGHVPVPSAGAGIFIGCWSHREQDGLGIRMQVEDVAARIHQKAAGDGRQAIDSIARERQ